MLLHHLVGLAGVLLPQQLGKLSHRGQWNAIVTQQHATTLTNRSTLEWIKPLTGGIVLVGKQLSMFVASDFEVWLPLAFNRISYASAEFCDLPMDATLKVVGVVEMTYVVVVMKVGFVVAVEAFVGSKQVGQFAAPFGMMNRNDPGIAWRDESQPLMGMPSGLGTSNGDRNRIEYRAIAVMEIVTREEMPDGEEQGIGQRELLDGQQ
eukprot:Gb_40029 [translate_table: standard]